MTHNSERPKPPSEQNDLPEEIELTPDDEAALDAAWDGITDDDIAASIAWLDKDGSE